MTTAKKLHPHEKKILEALQKLKKASVHELAKEAGLPESSVHNAGMWSKIKGFLTQHESVDQEITRTEEGERYRTEGLPEKRLLLEVAKGTTLRELRKKPDMRIALGWARQHNWVKLTNGTITLTPEGEKSFEETSPEERALETLEGDEATIEQLKKRKLVVVKNKKTITFALTQSGKRLKNLDTSDGIGQVTTALLRSGEWKGKDFRPYDATTPVPVIYPAKIHPYVQFINHTRRRLMSLGFQEIRGGFAELEFWNSDALFMPHDHPARSIHDLFQLQLPPGKIHNTLVQQRVAKAHANGWITGSKGWGHWDPKQTLNVVLRSHSTNLTARKLSEKPDTPAMFFSIGRVFRPDVLDATHSFEFHQCEGIVASKKVTMSSMLGYLRIFATDVAGADDVRFRPHYFPFTEPSVEMDALIDGKWIEVAGAGIFRPEVTQPLGVDVPVMGWSIGFSRLAMIKLGVNDIRDLYSHDLAYLREAPAVELCQH